MRMTMSMVVAHTDTRMRMTMSMVVHADTRMRMAMLMVVVHADRYADEDGHVHQSGRLIFLLRIAGFNHYFLAHYPLSSPRPTTR